MPPESVGFLYMRKLYSTRRSGIYLIKSAVNDKIYIGSAINLCYRRSRHIYDLKNDIHANIHLQRHFNKYGDDLEFSVLEYCEKDKLIEREQYYIDTLKPEFNICKIAGSCLGIKRSKETKKKISDSQKGEKSSWYGRRHTEESKKKLSNAQKGKKQSETHRKNNSKAQKKWRKENPFTEDEKEKFREMFNGEKSCRASLTNNQVSKIKEHINNGISVCEIARNNNINRVLVQSIKCETSWASIDPQITNKPKPRLTKLEVSKIKEQINKGIPVSEISKNCDVKIRAIYSIRSEDTYTDIEPIIKICHHG